MSHTSPASFLVWSILTSLLGAFLLFHLWSFDRFKCVRWNNGPNSGAFKRVMTYSYLLAVPLVMIYSIGFAVIKYKQGYVSLPDRRVVPKPYVQWDQASQNAIIPLLLIFSVAWSLEMVTHLEELCFWLFLINANSAQQNWFRSLYFKTWATGSIVAVIYMPLVTILTRNNVLQCESYTFLAGSLGSLSLTLWFTPVLWTFPSFLGNLRREGVDTATVVRLTKFAELNNIRIVFRFLMVIPFLVLGIDGVQPHHHVNENMFWTDILASVAAVGMCISSGLTLVIFFPRSIEGEIAARDNARERRKTGSVGRQRTVSIADTNLTQSLTGTGGGTYLLTASPVKVNFSDNGHDVGDANVPFNLQRLPEDVAEPLPLRSHGIPMRPNRRRGDDVELGGIPGLTDQNLSRHNLRQSNLNPMVHNFTSPINLGSYLPPSENHDAVKEPRAPRY